MIRGRPGGGGHPGMGSGGMSRVTSDISMNSRSRIFFATFVARDAAGLKGPGLLRDPMYTCSAA